MTEQHFPPKNLEKYALPSKNEIEAFVKSASSGDISKVETFLKDWPLAVNEKDSHTWTALMHAVWSCQQNVVASLIKHGINVREKDRWGRTSWVLAKRKGDRIIIGMIEDALKNK